MFQQPPRAAKGRIPRERRAIAKRIKAHRIVRGWSQAYLAQQIGVTSVTVSLWEAGQTAIRRERMRQLTRAFGIPVGELAPGATGEEPHERRQRVRQFWDQMIRHFKDCPNGDAHVAHMAATAETQRPEGDPGLGDRMAEDIRALHRKHNGKS